VFEKLQRTGYDSETMTRWRKTGTLSPARQNQVASGRSEEQGA
jgi:hypothetical protein